jgi:WD40 repeat protein
MAGVWGHRREIVAACLVCAGLWSSPPLAQNQGTDLYDRPVLVVDPRMHTAKINSQAVDVTGSDDRTVRIWSAVDGTLLRTIWIPVGPEKVGVIYAVAISPDGSTVAAGGLTERIASGNAIYLFDRGSGELIRRIDQDMPNVTTFLTFSPDGRHLAATLGSSGVRVFDRDRDWTEAFRDDQYRGQSDGAAFSRDGRLATTSFDGLIRLYEYDATDGAPNFRLVGVVTAVSGFRPRGVAFSPDGKKVAVGYSDVAAVDVLDATSLGRLGGQRPATVPSLSFQLGKVAWSADGQTLFAAGAV